MAQIRILIADDELSTRMFISAVLEEQGYEIETAENGQCALDLIVDNEKKGMAYDLLITDIQMPEMTGMELIDALKTQKSVIPVIVVSGFGEKEHLIRLLRSGCHDYLEKPVSQDELIGRVKTVLHTLEQSKHEAGRRFDMPEQKRRDLNRELENYRSCLSLQQRQIESAVNGYHNLVDLKSDRYKVELSWKNLPLGDLGGDFFDIRDTDTGCDIILADVAGHDMGASFQTILIKAFFDENCRNRRGGREFFQLLNQQFLEEKQNTRLATALFLRLNLKKMSAQMISAAHPALIYLRHKSLMPLPKAGKGDILGIFEDAAFKTVYFDISPGDRFILHTDGVSNVSRFNPDRGIKEKLAVNGLDALIQKHASMPLHEMIDDIWQDTLMYCRNKPQDDMLLAGIEIPLSA